MQNPNAKYKSFLRYFTLGLLTIPTLFISFIAGIYFLRTKAKMLKKEKATSLVFGFALSAVIIFATQLPSPTKVAMYKIFPEMGIVKERIEVEFPQLKISGMTINTTKYAGETTNSMHIIYQAESQLSESQSLRAGSIACTTLEKLKKPKDYVVISHYKQFKLLIIPLPFHITKSESISCEGVRE